MPTTIIKDPDTGQNIPVSSVGPVPTNEELAQAIRNYRAAQNPASSPVVRTGLPASPSAPSSTLSSLTNSDPPASSLLKPQWRQAYEYSAGGLRDYGVSFAPNGRNLAVFGEDLYDENNRIGDGSPIAYRRHGQIILWRHARPAAPPAPPLIPFATPPPPQPSFTPQPSAVPPPPTDPSPVLKSDDPNRLVTVTSAYSPTLRLPLAVALDPDKTDAARGVSSTQGFLDDLTMQLPLNPYSTPRLERRIARSQFGGTFTDEYVRKFLAGAYRGTFADLAAYVTKRVSGDTEAADVFRYGNSGGSGALGTAFGRALSRTGLSATTVETLGVLAEDLPGWGKLAVIPAGIAAMYGLDVADPINRMIDGDAEHLFGAEAAAARKQRAIDNARLYPHEEAAGNTAASLLYFRPSLPGLWESANNLAGRGIRLSESLLDPRAVTQAVRLQQLNAAAQLGVPTFNLARTGLAYLRGEKVDPFNTALEAISLTQTKPGLLSGGAHPAPEIANAAPSDPFAVGTVRYTLDGQQVQIVGKSSDGLLQTQADGEGQTRYQSPAQVAAETYAANREGQLDSEYSYLIRGPEDVLRAWENEGLSRRDAAQVADSWDAVAREDAARKGITVSDWYKDHGPRLIHGGEIVARRILAARGASQEDIVRAVVNGDLPRGMLEQDAHSLRSAITALSNPDVTTGLHEAGHSVRLLLTSGENAQLAQIFGASQNSNGDYIYDRRAEENFAEAVRYVAQARLARDAAYNRVPAPLRKAANWFRLLADRLQSAYPNLHQVNGLDGTPLNPELVRLIDSRFGRAATTRQALLDQASGITPGGAPVTGNTEPGRLVEDGPLFQPRRQKTQDEINAEDIKYPKEADQEPNYWKRMRLLQKAGLVFRHLTLTEAMKRNAELGILAAEVEPRADADKIVERSLFEPDGKPVPVGQLSYDGEAGGKKGLARIRLVGVNNQPIADHAPQGGVHNAAANGEASIASDKKPLTAFAVQMVEEFYKLQKAGRHIERLPVIVNRNARSNTSGNKESLELLRETVTKAMANGQYTQAELDNMVADAFSRAKRADKTHRLYPASLNITTWEQWERYAPKMTTGFNPRTRFLQNLLSPDVSKGRLPTFDEFTNAMLDPRMVHVPNPYMATAVLSVPHPTDAQGNRIDLVRELDGLSGNARKQKVLQIAREQMQVSAADERDNLDVKDYKYQRNPRIDVHTTYTHFFKNSRFEGWLPITHHTNLTMGPGFSVVRNGKTVQVPLTGNARKAVLVRTFPPEWLDMQFGGGFDRNGIDSKGNNDGNNGNGRDAGMDAPRDTAAARGDSSGGHGRGAGQASTNLPVGAEAASGDSGGPRNERRRGLPDGTRSASGRTTFRRPGTDTTSPASSPSLPGNADLLGEVPDLGTPATGQRRTTKRPARPDTTDPGSPGVSPDTPPPTSGKTTFYPAGIAPRSGSVLRFQPRRLAATPPQSPTTFLPPALGQNRQARRA